MCNHKADLSWFFAYPTLREVQQKNPEVEPMGDAGTYPAAGPGHDLRGDMIAWDAVFDIAVGDEQFAHMIDMVTARPADIFTAKLAQTRLFFNSVRTGSVSMLCPAHLAPDYATAIEVLTIIVTHARLARTGVAEMRSPGFWISRPHPPSPRSFSREPVLPISHLTTITGFTDTKLKTCLAPLVRDQAVQLVRNGDGVLGVVAAEGISDDGQARRFMRR